MSATRKSRKLFGEFIEHIVQFSPWPQPPPAFLYRFRRYKGLNKSLCARFIVHKRSIPFGKGGRRKQHVCLGGGAIRDAIKGDDMKEFRQELVHDRSEERR